MSPVEPCKLGYPGVMTKLNELAQRWRDVSSCPIKMLNGHIGAMDGWFPRTEMPGDQVNQTDYYSGHYQAYGLNVQAMCDPNLLFTYIAVAGPGKINDNRAFSRLRDLQNWMQSLPPPWCFVSADCAYGLNRRVMIPFTSAEILGEGYRAYNFYLSQLRIRIEMAFGLLTTKWRRLRSILNFANRNRKNAQIIRVCTKLLNFVIHMSHAEGNGAGRVGPFQVDTVNPLTYGILPLECGAGQVSEFGFLESSNVDDDSSCSLQWMDFDSNLHDACVADIISSGIRRPRFNIDHNNES